MAVLFDLDGTLVDTVPLILESVRHAFAGERRGPTDAEWIAGIGTPLRAQLQPWTDGPEHLERIVARYRAFQQEHHDRRTAAFPEAVEAVRALHARGHRIGVVTGKLSAPAARSLAHVGLAPYVSALVGADSCPHHKPDPGPVLAALERLGALPAEAAFVGDSAVDIRAGNAAGVVTIAALWGAATREELAAARPAHLCEHVRQVPPLVERLGT